MKQKLSLRLRINRLNKTGLNNDPIILYDYQRTWSGCCPRDFLKGFYGILQTDGYAGYSKVENAKRLYCLAHIRRKYHEIIDPLDKEALKTSRAIIGFNYCERLYEIEKELKTNYSDDDDFYEKRYKIRLEKSAPILDEFISYVDKEIVNALPRSPLGKALAYTQKLLPSFKIFLEDDSLEIDNNASERAIKPFFLGRKNWLFSNTPKGALSSATLFSIIETAKANQLIVEKYLIYLMEQLANRDVNDPDDLLKIMPWSKELPNELKIKAK